MQSMSIQDVIKDQVTKNKVVLYMKGSPDFPQCGFSANACNILRACGVEDFHTVNVLEDPEIRQGIKQYARPTWKTNPKAPLRVQPSSSPHEPRSDISKPVARSGPNTRGCGYARGGGISGSSPPCGRCSR